MKRIALILGAMALGATATFAATSAFVDRTPVNEPANVVHMIPANEEVEPTNIAMGPHIESNDDCGSVDKITDRLMSEGFEIAIAGTDQDGQGIYVWRDTTPSDTEDNLVLTVSTTMESCIATTFSEQSLGKAG